MDNPSWRQDALKQLETFLTAKDGVVSFSVFGSLSNPEVVKDAWSDIDALLVVKEASLNQFYPSTRWLEDLFGEIFATQVFQNGQKYNLKVIFSDFRKIDLIITTNNQELEEIHSNRANSSSDGVYEKLVQDFWFTAFVAITKLIRNDLLISLDLSLQLYRYCLQMAMILRDKETGTNIHRIGGVRNEIIEKMNIQLTKMDKNNIADLIEHTAKEFDALASEYTQSYKPHFPTFEKVILAAKKEISTPEESK